MLDVRELLSLVDAVKRLTASTSDCACLATKSRQAICSNVARILRQEREKRGISMTELAERTGPSQQMVSYVQREMRNPTLDTILRITAVPELDLADVIRRASERPRR